MSTKKIEGGIASEYDDQILWISKAEAGADAAQIIDETSYTPCTVTKIISRSDFADEDDYSAACDEIMNDSTATCTGEFVTFDDVYYVEIDSTGEAEEYDSIDFEDVEFC
ncbi:MAG: hypothetical protein K6G47_03285 [Clostridia bacterium]|nr:hypothetical protein [Clostridia bacterium]